MTDRIAAALATGSQAAHAEQAQAEADAPVKGKRRLTGSPTGFLSGFAQRMAIEADFHEQYLARSRLLGYEILPYEQVERARLEAARLRAMRGRG